MVAIENETEPECQGDLGYPGTRTTKAGPLSVGRVVEVGGRHVRAPLPQRRIPPDLQPGRCDSRCAGSAGNRDRCPDVRSGPFGVRFRDNSGATSKPSSRTTQGQRSVSDWLPDGVGSRPSSDTEAPHITSIPAHPPCTPPLGRQVGGDGRRFRAARWSPAWSRRSPRCERRRRSERRICPRPLPRVSCRPLR